MVQISASLLSANFTNLATEIRDIENAGADMLHFDVMDGHFVPNLTFGTKILKTIRSLTKLPLDVHLMVNNSELVINDYINSGADIITVHPETTTHISRTLSLIRQNGAKAGIALLPSTAPSVIDYIIDDIDLILVMTVNPGFGGQKFLDSQLPKIENLASKIINHNISLAVDGGINPQTAIKSVNAGAKILVAGNAIFSGGSYQENIRQLRIV